MLKWNSRIGLIFEKYSHWLFEVQKGKMAYLPPLDLHFSYCGSDKYGL